MKLYSNPLSPNCRKVHAFAKYAGLSIEIETVNLGNGANKEPAYLAINPNAKVPALVDGATTLWESNTILAYLASKQGSPAWPTNDTQFQVMKWLNWESCHFAPAVGKILGQVIFVPMRGGTPDQTIIQQGLEEFRRYGAVANGQLESTPFLTGSTPTIADFAVAVWLGYEQPCSLPISEYTHLTRWWKAIQALPGGTDLLPSR